MFRGTPIRQNREHLGHLHYFSNDTALLTLQDAGYEIVDWFYTPSGVDRPANMMEKIVRWPRRIAAAIHADPAARILGGYSMLVLAR